MKQNLLVVFGGKSCEHDISVITAVQAMNHADGGKYEIIPLYIREGLYTGKRLTELETYRDFDGNKARLRRAEFAFGGIKTYRFPWAKRYVPIDCALLCCHGGIGENGGLQGLLEFYGIPYTSPDTAASAVCMDKVLTKEVLLSLGLPVLPYFVAYDSEIDGIEPPKNLSYPLIVKPASQGSSIGIAVAHSLDELKSACLTAAEFGRKILVETALTDFYEINCAAVKRDGKILVSECEKPVSWSEFLSFDEKYLSGGKADGKSGGEGKSASEGMKSLKREYPAKLPKALKKSIVNFTEKAYSALDMRGSVRIDFLVDRSEGRVYLNEINTIPGSLAYYLFEKNGISFGELIDIAVLEGIADKRRGDQKNYVYESSVLETQNGTKNVKLNVED
ncbi:MAG: hypothetical protein LBT20_08595 [Clostridiales bacterium]|jgi:D-alanine-D-alanine ligase|nr:hypothetical protein [Clostridiales bacterium]